MAAIFWKTSVNGDWNVAANWTTGTVPTSADDVFISAVVAPGPYIVTISSADVANSLEFAAPQAELVENAGSLTMGGALVVNSGFVSLNAANAIGGVAVGGGVLAFGAADALGVGTVTMTGGELLGTANENIFNALNIAIASTIAAAHGTTLNENSTNYTVNANTTLNIGSPGEDGTILWHTNAGSSASSTDDIHVQAGTLRAADASFSLLVGGVAQTTVDSGATIDIADFDTSISDLLGGGTVTNSGIGATLTLDAANFSGTISGALVVTFNGDAVLSGLEDYVGGALLNGPITVANEGTYDLVLNANIAGASASSFVNSGLMEKTGFRSRVFSNFVNSGTINVLSGSIQFSSGFTNNGVIHGLVTQSGGVTTISAAVPSDFNGDALSDILFQNTSSGQASIWDMSGNARTGGGTVSPNPGPAWKAVGTGDFNGDGHADILWQNTDGQAAIWEMNGETRIGGGAISPNPGPAWKAIGTGDFNGDGLSGILWQNTSTGQLSVWEMNGSTRTGGGAVSVNPGPTWKAVGSGDFNGDGNADILFQNTSTGQVAIWEMNGSTRTGGGALSTNPGPAWKAIGTGDFNGDGLADILFQNTSTGQVSIWEMDGTTRIGGGPVSVNPGPAWHAVGTGDFTGDGFSDDILFQNANGQAAIWEMNGATRTGGGAVSVNPGTSWRAIGA